MSNIEKALTLLFVSVFVNFWFFETSETIVVAISQTKNLIISARRRNFEKNNINHELTNEVNDLQPQKDYNYLGILDTTVSVAVPGDQCIIFSTEEGDPDRCWCPDGYILCTWQDVEEVQKKDLKSPWLQILCKNEIEGGFNGTLVYIDYELSVECKNDARNPPAFRYSLATPAAFVDPNRLKEEGSAARRCHGSRFFLCKPAPNKNDKVDCQITEWSNWDHLCINNIQRRYRTVIKSGEHGGKTCIWNGEFPREHKIEELRECPNFYDNSRKLWTGKNKLEGIIRA